MVPRREGVSHREFHPVVGSCGIGVCFLRPCGRSIRNRIHNIE